MTEDEKKDGADKNDHRRLHSFPLIRHSDMAEEMRTEAMELCVTACEKFSTSNEAASKMIKENMDKKFGSSWHVVVGEGFGFEITYETKNLLYMFFGGSVAIASGSVPELIWHVIWSDHVYIWNAATRTL